MTYVVDSVTLSDTQLFLLSCLRNGVAIHGPRAPGEVHLVFEPTLRSTAVVNMMGLIYGFTASHLCIRTVMCIVCLSNGNSVLCEDAHVF